MANNTPINLRIKFKKVGKLQYISHLDLVRTMHKIVVRSGLPIWYTEGFNPKPKMVFAAPLSIGTESYAEYMDLRLDEQVDCDEAVRALNTNMTDELFVIEAYYPQSKLTDLKWLSYTIKIHTENASADLAEACECALNAKSVVVLKQTKSGEKEVDIRHLIKNAYVALDNGVLRISTILSADASCFLNPEYVVSYLKEKCGVLASADLMTESYSITREQGFFGNMDPFL